MDVTDFRESFSQTGFFFLYFVHYPPSIVNQKMFNKLNR